jgi:hypothetical protein
MERGHLWNSRRCADIIKIVLSYISCINVFQIGLGLLVYFCDHVYEIWPGLTSVLQMEQNRLHKELALLFASPVVTFSALKVKFASISLSHFFPFHVGFL